MTKKTKIVVLDDDPTGSQTVHSCPLLTQWDVETLIWVLCDDTSPLFFVLTNTRGMSSTDAETLTRQVCNNLKVALERLSSLSEPVFINPLLVSRSDSTLRGHYPVETNVIASELGPFDAHFLVPAFFEGGRITKDSTHYLLVDQKNGQQTAIPCHETEFAKDSVFGYTTSYLPNYVEEKTRGAIRADQVVRFQHSDPDVKAGDCQQRLLALHCNTCCAVDAISQSDLDKFCQQLLTVAEKHNKRFLFRSGASLLTSLARLPSQPIPPEYMAQYVPHSRPGAVLVGSHVQKTTAQLAVLLQQPLAVGMEVDVSRIRRGEQAIMLREFTRSIDDVHARGYVPVIHTSRTELVDFASQEERLVFGQQVSAFLMDIVHRLPKTLGYLISKGGITSNDVLSKGLELRASFVLGQVIPGCSVVKCPEDHPRYPNMPVVIFPGNVGDEHGLATVLNRLSSVGMSTQQVPQQQEYTNMGHNNPAQIHRMITKRFQQLRKLGLSTEEAMTQAREELAPSAEFEPDVGSQVAAMFGMQF
jgi:uncharacterized protein YgbK (DUF1537 family)